jgi:hypothetical protein
MFFVKKAKHLRIYSMVMILLLDEGADGATELPRNDDEDWKASVLKTMTSSRKALLQI